MAKTTIQPSQLLATSAIKALAILQPDAGLVRLQMCVILLPLFEIAPQIERSSLDTEYGHVPPGHPRFSHLKAQACSHDHEQGCVKGDMGQKNTSTMGKHHVALPLLLVSLSLALCSAFQG